MAVAPRAPSGIRRSWGMAIARMTGNHIILKLDELIVIVDTLQRGRLKAKIRILASKPVNLLTYFAKTAWQAHATCTSNM